ncbi:MAG TPA: MFS transporter, partial [Kofleriaceae bacterium]
MPDPRARLSPVFWVLFGGTLINRAASFVGLFLALHLTQDLGMSTRLAGGLVGCWGVGSLLASPVAGVLTDRVGRKATMLLGLVPGGLAVLSLAFTDSVPVLFGLCFFGGAAQQLYFPSSSAAIADLVPSADRARAYGLIYWAANLGLGIGFAVGGL